MGLAWRTVLWAVVDVRDDLADLVVYNLLWFFCCLPLVTAPPATAALYAVTREMVYRQDVEWRSFFRAFKEYAWVGWRFGLVNLAALLIVLMNFWFYGYFVQPFRALLTSLWVGIALIWTMIQLYCFPVLLEQEDRKVRQALWNALALCVRHPLFTLVYLLVTVVLLAYSVLVPFLVMLLTVSFLFFFHGRGVYYLLQIERGNDPQTERAALHGYKG
jgi:uncharacterized membrane protein YesL